MKHADIIQTLDLEQKCALLSGGTVFDTRALPGKNVPSITLSDGPNGVRKQAGAADHLGLNPSVPATCFRRSFSRGKRSYTLSMSAFRSPLRQ